MTGRGRIAGAHRFFPAIGRCRQQRRARETGSNDAPQGRQAGPALESRRRGRLARCVDHHRPRVDRDARCQHPLAQAARFLRWRKKQRRRGWIQLELAF
jgi:hypothetical protein